jgi:hypothetical protein
MLENQWNACGISYLSLEYSLINPHTLECFWNIVKKFPSFGSTANILKFFLLPIVYEIEALNSGQSRMKIKFVNFLVTPAKSINVLLSI